ncbi:SPOR domain-containing protein, partial [Treponema endosymbiont of Eucomonympha sp.]|uniref:SPOR domain-containing protein n=1 Tax=Treponema endosymbiont of Eucomonympha sp. TaxID=1580831 RepID=UPI000A548FF9
PKAKTAAGKEYWVQAASFTVRKNAESALAVLAENKLQGEIFTHIDATGKTFYRVRVGPYATETEAKSWQEHIETTLTKRKIEHVLKQIKPLKAAIL